MRDIIFRGIGIKSREWVYGAYVPAMDEDDCDSIIDEQGEHHIVFSDTVGQYTGLKDRAGEMIWEGDILSDGAFTYEVRYKGTGFVTISDGHVYTMDTRLTKIVIGSIHDHPDLLK